MIYNGCWTGAMILGGGALAAIVITLIMQRIFSTAELRDGHHFTTALLAIVGTLYAVLLGLIVVDAMARFERAMDGAQMESNCLADIFLLGNRLPEPYRARVRDLCRTYARQVVDEEWPMMAQGRMNPAVRQTALALATSLDGFEPASESEKVVYPAILEQIRQFWDRRRERAGTCEIGIPPVQWVSLVAGAVVTMVLGGMFHVGSERLRLVVTVLASLVIGLNLYLVNLFGYPFAGDLTVSSHPFEVDIAIFDHSDSLVQPKAFTP
ncbi:MAG: hypothetical protein ACKO4T_03240 [Planctomycetaceae bacterium]